MLLSVAHACTRPALTLNTRAFLLCASLVSGVCSFEFPVPAVSITLMLVVAIIIGVVFVRYRKPPLKGAAAQEVAYDTHELTRADRVAMLRANGQGSSASTASTLSTETVQATAAGADGRFDWLTVPGQGSTGSGMSTDSDRRAWLKIQGAGSGVSNVTASSSNTHFEDVPIERVTDI